VGACFPFLYRTKLHWTQIRQMSTPIFRIFPHFTCSIGLSGRYKLSLEGSLETLRGSLVFLRGSFGSLRGSLALLRDSLVFLRGSLALLRDSLVLLRGSLALLRGSLDLQSGSLDSFSGGFGGFDVFHRTKSHWTCPISKMYGRKFPIRNQKTALASRLEFVSGCRCRTSQSIP
jgi:hypothetical protein